VRRLDISVRRVDMPVRRVDSSVRCSDRAVRWVESLVRCREYSTEARSVSDVSTGGMTGTSAIVPSEVSNSSMVGDLFIVYMGIRAAGGALPSEAGAACACSTVLCALLRRIRRLMRAAGPRTIR